MAQEDFRTDAPSSKPIFMPVNVTDPRLALIADSINYPVHKGAQNISAYRQQAASASSSGINWNIILPSKASVMAPVAYMDCTVQITVNVKTGNDGAPLFAFGKDTAFADFPLNGMFDIVTLTINSAAVSWEANQTIDFVKKLLPKKLLDHYASTAPVQPDIFANYSDVAAGPNDVLSGFDKAYQAISRGGYDCEVTPSAAIPNGDGAAHQVILTCKFREPVLLSPFQLSNAKYSSGGFHGVSTVRLNNTFVAPGNNFAIRSTRGTGAGNYFNITGIACQAESCFLELFFLTPPPEMPIPVRNVRNYLDIVRGVTTMSNYTINAGVKDTRTINSIQLGTMPEKICIGVRRSKTSGGRTCNSADVWLPITQLSLTLNNNSAILANCTQDMLYNMSVEAGLQNTPWWVAKGSALSSAGAVQTCGSFLVFDVARHLQVDSVYAPGSIGAYNFYGSVTFQNPSATNITNTDYEIVCLFLNNCVMVTELGATSVFPSVLSKEAVLEASNQPSVKNPNRIAALQGGSWYDKSMKLAKHKAPMEKIDIFNGKGHTGGSSRLASRLAK